jgi:putative nucleotidyltransferase with HDIG domain
LFEFTGSGLFKGSKGFLNEIKSQKESDILTDEDSNYEKTAASENEKYAPDISLLMQSFKKKAENTDIEAISKALEILKAILNEPQNSFCLEFAASLKSYVEWIYVHSFNVAVISLLIAMDQGFCDEELYQIGLGAFLHDVGKLYVPKAIIQKPGALDDAEMSYVRRHCEEGIRLLSPFCISKECMDIVWQHHERLDGSGYPKRLKSDDISQYAKIVMIADVIDAVTSERPYKRPQKISDAINILKNDRAKFSMELVISIEKVLETKRND